MTKDYFREVWKEKGPLAALRLFLPPKMPSIPTKEDIVRAEEETALGIVARQGEGSVLLSAGLIDMTGVDLEEKETLSKSGA